MADEKKQLRDNVRRVKQNSLPGTLTWIGLRAADPLLQYGILNGTVGAPIVRALHGTLVSQGPTSNTGLAVLDNLQLSPYRLILFSMAVGASVKHVFWKLAISEQYFPAQDAATVCMFNTVFNSLNSFFFINKLTSPGWGRGEGPHWAGWPGAPLVVGSALFLGGILLETVSELQRKAFKSKPENNRKVYTGGLFSLARHINYGGYTLWRSGFALASGGWIWGSITAAFFASDFIGRGIPVLDQYCQDRYADMWSDYKARTPYALLPYIY